MYELGSRYHGVPFSTVSLKEPGEEPVEIVYLRRRLVPEPLTIPAWFEGLSRGERLDLVSAQRLGDATAWWRLCDASRALHPLELEEAGRTVRAPMPWSGAAPWRR